MKLSMATRFAAFACAVMAVPALATPINIDTGKQLNLNPGTSGTLTLSLTNQDAGTAVTTFNAWGLILQLIPQPGATGSATFTNLLSPATNGALTDPGDPLLDPAYELTTAVNGTIGAYQLSIGNNSAVTTTFALGQSYNIGDLTVALSPGATGAWTIYALNDANDTTSWLNAGGAATAFGNVPTAGTQGQYSANPIGTINAVPEPASIGLAALAVGGCSLVWRRRAGAAKRAKEALAA